MKIGRPHVVVLMMPMIVPMSMIVRVIVPMPMPMLFKPENEHAAAVYQQAQHRDDERLIDGDFHRPEYRCSPAKYTAVRAPNIRSSPLIADLRLFRPLRQF